MSVGRKELEKEEANDERLVKLLTDAMVPHSLFPSRKREFAAVKGYARAYGIEIDEDDFDIAYAELFGGGCELEWPKE